MIIEKFNPQTRGTAAELALFEMMKDVQGKAELLFTPTGRCVGWIFEGGKQVFPAYSDTAIICD